MLPHSDVPAVAAPLRPYDRAPLATPAQTATEVPAFPVPTVELPLQSLFGDWRQRLTRNLSRRSDSRWDPLTYLHAAPVREP
ncbi:MAG TPA: hypothetical protein VEA99_09455 [Gemmatimonadaceae bacterium]|nr:hypothetical protein [Gemmatimonadaceae bacterium]